MQIIFYFKEKQYLCNPKQTITHYIFCSVTTYLFVNNNNKKYILK